MRSKKRREPGSDMDGTLRGSDALQAVCHMKGAGKVRRRVVLLT